jgi:hypothetical protein
MEYVLVLVGTAATFALLRLLVGLLVGLLLALLLALLVLGGRPPCEDVHPAITSTRAAMASQATLLMTPAS